MDLLRSIKLRVVEKMTQTVIRAKPVNLTGLWKFLDELAKETIEVLKKRGISLTVEDFLKERER